MAKDKMSIIERLKFSLDQIVSGGDNSAKAEGKKLRRNRAEEEIESAIIVLAAEVLRLKGNDSDKSRNLLLTFLEKHFGEQGPLRKKLILEHLSLGPQPYTRLACTQIKSLTSGNTRSELLCLLFDLAVSDDSIRAKETAVIKKISRYLEIEEAFFLSIYEKYLRVHDPYLLLGLSETADKRDVRAAWRKAALKYHPDKQSDGTAADEASQKFREAKRAFELIMQKLKDRHS